MTDASFVAEDGKRYRIIAGAIRNNGAPNYWELISDAAHVPVGIASVTSDGEKVVVNYDFTAKTIGTFIATPDETLGRMGIFCGASVGLSSASIVLSQGADSVTDLVYYDGMNWVSQNLQFTIDSFIGGVLTLSHRTVVSTSGNVQVGSRGGSRRAVLAAAGGPTSPTMVKIEFYDNSGTLITTPDTGMRALVTRTGRPGARNPRTIVDTTTEPYHNVWIWGCHEVDEREA